MRNSSCRRSLFIALGGGGGGGDGGAVGLVADALVHDLGHLGDRLGGVGEGLGGDEAVLGPGDDVELVDAGGHGVNEAGDFGHVGEGLLVDGGQGPVSGTEAGADGGLGGEVGGAAGEL